MGIFKLLRDLVSTDEAARPPSDEVLLRELRNCCRQPEMLSESQVKRLDDQLIACMHFAEPEKAFALAHEYMQDGQFAAAVYLYKHIAEHYDAHRHNAEALVGLNYYCLGQFERAMEAYVAARVHGANPEWVDDLMWEASETACTCSPELRRKDEALQHYLRLNPKGRHQERAHQLQQSLREVA